MTQPVKQPPSLNPFPLRDRMKMPRQHMPEQSAARARPQFQGSEPRLLRGAGAAGSPAVPGMRQTDLHRRLSCRREGARIRSVDRGGRLPGRGGQDSRRQRAAGHHRPRLPAGRPLRRRLRAAQERRVAGHWLPGTLRRRLRAAPPGNPQCPEGAADRERKWPS